MHIKERKKNKLLRRRNYDNFTAVVKLIQVAWMNAQNFGRFWGSVINRLDFSAKTVWHRTIWAYSPPDSEIGRCGTRAALFATSATNCWST